MMYFIQDSIWFWKNYTPYSNYRGLKIFSAIIPYIKFIRLEQMGRIV